MGSKKLDSTSSKNKGSFRSIFMHADNIDKLLMTLGFLGSVGDGVLMPMMLLVTSELMNNIGDAASSVTKDFRHSINKVGLLISYPSPHKPSFKIFTSVFLTKLVLPSCRMH